MRKEMSVLKWRLIVMHIRCSALFSSGKDTHAEAPLHLPQLISINIVYEERYLIPIMLFNNPTTMTDAPIPPVVEDLAVACLHV